MKGLDRRAVGPARSVDVPETALVLGNYRAGLTAARRLKRLGYRVVVGKAPDSYCAERSRFVDQMWEAPAPHDPEFGEVVLEFLGEHPDVSVVVPVLEPYMDVLAAMADDMDEKVAVTMPAPKVVAICHDKHRWFQFTSEAGVDNPRFGLAADRDELVGLVREIGCPVVIKPTEGGKRLGRLKAITINDERDLDYQLPEWPRDHRALMVQRRFEGQRYNIYFAALEGAILREQTSLSLRTARFDGSGQTVEGVTRPAIPSLSADLAVVAAKLEYSGVGCAQYLYDEASGQSLFLEINPRFGASYAIVEHLGMDLTGLAIELSHKRPPAMAARPPYESDSGTRFTWTYGDLAGLAESRARGDLTWRQAGRWLASALRGAIRTRVHVTWSWRDPMPALSIPFKGVGTWLAIKAHRPVARSARAKG
ncbi:MAG: hypothetical protein ACR2NL_11010 [Acidimicrobiia bacterium]